VRTLTPLALAELAVVCTLILSSTFTAFVLAANRARALLRSARAMRFAHRAAGGVMAGAAVAIATR
jgi:threonine/homoserine/homoserine lactone efflux protein